jgi:hypothetical protein
MHSFVILCETNVLNIISQCFNIFYQIQTKYYSGLLCSELFGGRKIGRTKQGRRQIILYRSALLEIVSVLVSVRGERARRAAVDLFSAGRVTADGTECELISVVKHVALLSVLLKTGAWRHRVEGGPGPRELRVGAAAG